MDRIIGFQDEKFVSGPHMQVGKHWNRQCDMPVLSAIGQKYFICFNTLSDLQGIYLKKQERLNNVISFVKCSEHK